MGKPGGLWIDRPQRGHNMLAHSNAMGNGGYSKYPKRIPPPAPPPHGVAMGYYDAAPSGAINVALPVF